jgi:hypothetical protein
MPKKLGDRFEAQHLELTIAALDPTKTRLPQLMEEELAVLHLNTRLESPTSTLSRLTILTPPKDINLSTIYDPVFELFKDESVLTLGATETELAKIRRLALRYENRACAPSPDDMFRDRLRLWDPVSAREDLAIFAIASTALNDVVLKPTSPLVHTLHEKLLAQLKEWRALCIKTSVDASKHDDTTRIISRIATLSAILSIPEIALPMERYHARYGTEIHSLLAAGTEAGCRIDEINVLINNMGARFVMGEKSPANSAIRGLDSLLTQASPLRIHSELKEWLPFISDLLSSQSTGGSEEATEALDHPPVQEVLYRHLAKRLSALKEIFAALAQNPQDEQLTVLRSSFQDSFIVATSLLRELLKNPNVTFGTGLISLASDDPTILAEQLRCAHLEDCSKEQTTVESDDILAAVLPIPIKPTEPFARFEFEICTTIANVEKITNSAGEILGISFQELGFPEGILYAAAGQTILNNRAKLSNSEKIWAANVATMALLAEPVVRESLSGIGLSFVVDLMRRLALASGHGNQYLDEPLIRGYE